MGNKRHPLSNEKQPLLSPEVMDELEIDTDIQNKKKLIKASLKKVPLGEKIDMKVDDLYSDYYNTELQIKLKNIYDKVNSPMRIVGDYLDINHSRLKDKDIFYKELADALGLTQSQVYSAVMKLQAFEGYSFTFHPSRKKGKACSFRFSIDDYTGWCKENDIREKIINRKIIVVRKSQDRMSPRFKEKIKLYKIKRIKELKKKIIEQEILE